MDMRWSLDSLYKSFDERYEKDVRLCREKAESLESLTGKIFSSSKDMNPVQAAELYIAEMQKFEELFSALYNYAELVLSVESDNEQAQKYLDILQNTEVLLTPSLIRFMKWVGNMSDIKNLISSSELLKEHRFFIMENREKSRHLLSEKEEILASRMKNTGSNAWTKLWNTITANHRVDFDFKGENKKLPLSIVRNMAYDADAEKRKVAYEAESESYSAIEDSGAAALNSIKGEVLSMSKMRGFSSPLEKTLSDSRMDKATLDAMLEAMKEYMPLFRSYYRRKSELLGHNGALPFYDLFAPIGSVDLSFSYEETRDFIIEKFKMFSEELSSFAEKAFDSRWIDAQPRAGKRGGAFCMNLHSVGESRVLANFDGSFSNVRTLAHELGHAYHGSCLRNESILNSHYPMPLAETASIFCETIIHNAAVSEADDKNAFVITEKNLAMSGQVIVDIYSRFRFETMLFEERKKGSLSVKELKQLMLRAQDEAYGDALDKDIRHPYMWLNKPHYYYADHNFYNFPYAFGLLFAKGLYAVYREEGESFIPNYKKLLAQTGKSTVKDVVSLMDRDVADVAFWKNSLEITAEEIRSFLEMSK
ncbi:MAG: M3 family oligoendopeptidase [bacterium]